MSTGVSIQPRAPPLRVRTHCSLDNSSGCPCSHRASSTSMASPVLLQNQLSVPPKRRPPVHTPWLAYSKNQATIISFVLICANKILTWETFQPLSDEIVLLVRIQGHQMHSTCSTHQEWFSPRLNNKNYQPNHETKNDLLYKCVRGDHVIASAKFNLSKICSKKYNVKHKHKFSVISYHCRLQQHP